jgi:hypothetical protein
MVRTKHDEEQGCGCGEEGKKVVHHHHGGSGGAVYGTGLIGALIYFIQHATSFGMGILGVLKALVWPVIVVYKLLEFLKL